MPPLLHASLFYLIRFIIAHSLFHSVHVNSFLKECVPFGKDAILTYKAFLYNYWHIPWKYWDVCYMWSVRVKFSDNFLWIIRKFLWISQKNFVKINYDKMSKAKSKLVQNKRKKKCWKKSKTPLEKTSEE